MNKVNVINPEIVVHGTLGRYQKTKKTVSQVNPGCRKCGAKMDGKELSE